MSSKNKKHSGFTLIELLVVIAILATIAGGILVSYDGLETDAAQGQATFNIGATDRAVRTYRTLNKSFPTNLDSLMFSPDGTGTDTVEGLNLLNSKIKGKIGIHTLTAGGATALTTAGISQLRFVAGDITSAGAGTPAANYVNSPAPGTLPFIPNRVFDNTSRGWGESVPLAAGVKVAIMETNGVTMLSGAVGTNSTRLRDIAGLDETLTHHVVVVGLGNTSSMVAESALGTTLGRTGTLAEAPYYTNLTKFEYGRYLLLFHIGSSATTGGAVTYFSEAKFIAVLDTKGDWLDEEMAEYNNSKL
jgi:prepilin-type N-terminal cleavage/methylation domain-containing protein